MADESTTTTTTTTPPTSTTTTTTTPPEKTATPPTATSEVEVLKAKLKAAEELAAAGQTAQTKLAELNAAQETAEKKRLEEQGQWRELAEREKNQSATLRGQILKERVRSTALAQGLIDESLVGMIATDDTFLVNGAPDQAKIDKAVADFKTSKAHFFKAAAATTTGGGTTPPASTDTRPKFDFSKATNRADAERLFGEAMRGLRR